MTLEITLTDTEHDVSVELEAKRLGNLGVKAITDMLVSSGNTATHDSTTSDTTTSDTTTSDMAADT